jgi:hypothetical protein
MNVRWVIFQWLVKKLEARQHEERKKVQKVKWGGVGGVGL